ncbi:MAG: ion transporter [Spirochaetes bacterium]|nr:ion transporter [Spirochaetota bacterium]MBU0954982.1 ion transporter [Spirochaetota bacterium]
MIAADSKFRFFWNILISLVSIGAVLVLPLSLVYPILSPAMAVLSGLFLSMLFAIDLVLEFFTSYVRIGQVVTDRKEIASRYLRHGFVLDLISALPWFLMVSLLFESGSSAFSLIGLVHLLKLVKANRLVKTLVEERINPAILRLMLLVFWIIIAAHLISCAWIIVSGNPDQLAPVDRYVLAMYWTVTTITTIGYGDITPKGTTQILFVIMVEIFGAAMYGLVIGNIAGLIANIDVAKTQYKEKLEKINAFFKYRAIPAEIKRKIDNYYAYLWETRRGYNEMAILDDLPNALKESVALCLNKEIIEKVPLFNSAEPPLIRDIIINLKPAVFTPGDYVVRAGEYGDEVFFISRGSVDVMSPDETAKYATLTSGAFFGEMALLLSTARTATIKAVEYCDLYVLDKATFDKVIGRYPAFQESIRKMAEERRKQNEAAARK